VKKDGLPEWKSGLLSTRARRWIKALLAPRQKEGPATQDPD
jgi:hypothetical protein